MPANRSKLILSALALATGALAALAQTTGPATTTTTTSPQGTGFVTTFSNINPTNVSTGPGPLNFPATAPASAPAGTIQLGTTPAPVAVGSPTSEPTVIQPFVATITGDKVYIRSGPSSTTYYEVGQLVKGDTVYVVGASKDYYKILPPNGSYCLIAKEFVDVDAVPGGPGTALVKADYVNVRAGTAIYKTRDTSILTVVRKGDKLKVLGGGAATDKYVMIAPPEHAYFYVKAEFAAKAPEGTEYKVADLKLPSGVTGPTATVTAPTTLPTVSVQVETRPGNVILPPIASTNPTTGPVATTEPLPLPVPVQFSATATQKFKDLNDRYIADAKKPIADREPEALITEYKILLAMDNLSPSVKSGSEQMIQELEKTVVLKRLTVSSQQTDAAIAADREAMNRQFVAAQKAMDDYHASAPYDFSGVLQTSTIVQGKYTLVNPANGRVVAYIDPQSEVDVAIFIGKYIGVRGQVSTPQGADYKLVKVATATLMPAPK